MHLGKLTLISTAVLLSACSNGADTNTAKMDRTVVEAATDVAGEIEMRGADLSALPSGTYKSEQGHAYVAFQYWHQEYSRPIIRWGTTDATIVFDNENPENSTLSVSLPTEDLDTGVEAWDKHIKSADFFDVETIPKSHLFRRISHKSKMATVH